MVTRVVQNVAKNPGTGMPYANKRVSIRASGPVFVDRGATEILRDRYIDTDETGLWSCELDVLGEGEFYSVREASGLIWYFAPTDGDGALNLFDCLTVTPPQLPPVVTIKGNDGDEGPQGEQGPTGATGPGVPTGGASGTVLAKTSGTDLATGWVDLSGTYAPLSKGVAVSTDPGGAIVLTVG